MPKKVKQYSIPITVRVEDAMKRELEEYCEKHSTCISSLIRALLKKALTVP